MKNEIQDLAKRLEQGEIDKATFDEGVRSLIESSAAEAAPAEAEIAAETHAVRSREISFAAKRAREL